MPESPKPWPDLLAAAVGERVAHYRRERGFTAQQLSNALREQLGVDMKRTVLGGLESGVRKAVTLSEILALAYVLGVPPLLLITPVGEEPEFEALPGMRTDTWDVAQWITGEGPPPRDGPEDRARELWRRHVDLLTLYREHAAKERDWKARTRIAVADSPDERNDLFERALTRRREIEDGLRLIRRAIRGRGDLPPALPPELAHLDADEPVPRLRPVDPSPPPVADSADVERAIEARRSRRGVKVDPTHINEEGGSDGSTEDPTGSGR